jgi:hypothetical protein
MNNLIDKFKKEQSAKLNRLLIESNVLSQDETEKLLYGLSEIADSFLQVYERIIPEILEQEEKKNIKDKLWDLREEFRHIQYHLDDGNFLEL